MWASGIVLPTHFWWLFLWTWTIFSQLGQISTQPKVEAFLCRSLDFFSVQGGVFPWNALLSGTLLLNVAFPVPQIVKNLPAMQEMQELWVRSPGWKDPLEKGMATHSSVLAWRIPPTEEPGGLQSMGSQRLRHDWVTDTFTLVSVVSLNCFLNLERL